MKNAGTVPAHIRCNFLYATVESDDDPLRDLDLIENGWTFDPVTNTWENSGCLFDEMIGQTGAAVINWYLKLVVPPSRDPCAVQLEPCNEYPAEIHFDFKQEAQECHTYKFGFEIDAIQWNLDYEWDT